MHGTGVLAMQQVKTRTKWSSEDLEFLKSNHISLSYNEIAEHLGRTYANVNCKITRLGLGDNTPNYRYTMRPDVLQDDEFSGYLAGLWGADGCLSSTDGRIAHKFHKKDSEYLTDVYSNLVNESVCFDKSTSSSNIVSFRATLPTFRSYLEQVGITPQKTYTLNIDFERFPEPWIKGFLSGYLDGDGWVYTHPKRYEQRIGFVSSGNILSNIQSFLGYGKLYDRGTYSQLLFSSRYANTLAKYLEYNKYQFPRKKKKLSMLLETFKG